MKKIEISGRKIGFEYSPYVIAELSANHNGKLENALSLVEEAKKAGADAIKLQTYKPSTITLDCDSDEFKIQGGLWDGRTLYELYQEAHMPWEWHKPLFSHAEKLGITIFSTPFDTTAVDFLEDLNVPAYKIASFEAIDLPLIKYVASTGKPMIISTGMIDTEEIEEAVDAARSGGCNELALLHCVSGYPAPIEDCNLLTITDMIERYRLVTGLSDHTLGSTVAIASVALGASIIEKHFTLDRSGGGPDDSFSIEPSEMALMIKSIRECKLAMGRADYSLKSSEKLNIKYQRSIYYILDMNEGDIITQECVKSVRPGNGIRPKYMPQILGKKLKRKVNKNTPVSFDDFS